MENQGVDLYAGQYCGQQLSPGLPMQVSVKYTANLQSYKPQ